MSVTFTDGATDTFVCTVAFWLLPALTAIVAAAAAVPVALNVTDDNPVELTVSVFAPAVVPSFQLPTVAIPLAFVVAPPPVSEPPTGADREGDSDARDRVAVHIGDEYRRSCRDIRVHRRGLAVTGVDRHRARGIRQAVALNVIGLPARPVELAVSVFAPAAVPSIQEPTVAMPSAALVAFAPVSEPPPEPMAKVTETPATGLPYWSAIETDGAVETVVSTVAVWLSPPSSAIEAAAPATPVAWNVIDDRPVELTERVLAPAVVPSCHELTVAMPLASVVALAPVSEPPPEPIEKVTATPGPGWHARR